MASPYAGSDNFLAYLALIEATSEEEIVGLLQSEVGMSNQREFPQWAQIPLKEALLIRFWLEKNNLFSDFEKRSDTIFISRDIQNKISLLLNKFFHIPLLFAVPKCEYDSLSKKGGIYFALSHNSSFSTGDRLKEFKKQKYASESELNMVYLTDYEKNSLFVSWFTAEKVYYDAQYDLWREIEAELSHLE